VEVGGISADCEVRHPGATPDTFRYATSDDVDLWFRLLEAGYEIVTTREPLAVYRWGEAGRSRTTWVIADAALRSYERALERGRLDAAQRRVMRRHIRHQKALIARGRLSEALAGGRRREALGLAPRAVGRGAVAFLQAPRRWGEWAGEALRRRQPA
jgi:GT2 family glycosyltransferase